MLGECIQYIQSEMRPAAQSQPGSLGLSLLASPELGAAVLESFWASDHACGRARRQQRLYTVNWPGGLEAR